MRKVVINVCFGGFGLSPEALQRAHALGAKNAIPIEKYYGKAENKRIPEDLKKWREYQKAPTGNQHFLVVFTDDEKNVLQENFDRDDPILIQVVEEMGERAWGHCAKLEIIEIPDDVQWNIEEYDGNEHIAEAHRTWR